MIADIHSIGHSLGRGPFSPSSDQAAVYRRLRLGILTPHNPYDRRAFSGTAFHAFDALSRRRDIDVELIGPYQPMGRIGQLLRRSPSRFEPHMLASDGSDFQGFDVVMGLVASALLDEAAMLTTLPMIHVTDATPGFLEEVYNRALPASAATREARVLRRCVTVYSSQMMAERAQSEFPQQAPAVQSVPFGVNFPDLPAGLVHKAPLDRLELLFVASDWDRKGGDLVLDAFAHLQAQGRAAHLTLVGDVPDDVATALKHRNDITITGFLDKNRPRHMIRLRTLFERAHVFMLPTRADCTPMVLGEAMIHGTPVLATDVGAIGEMVGASAGQTLPLSATGADWAACLTEMTADPAVYAMLTDGARERAETRLNWDRWASRMTALAAEMVDTRIKTAA
ncbi:MAG: glycosyltransferase family 4 protein [Pseudomonadota bacterium]